MSNTGRFILTLVAVPVLLVSNAACGGEEDLDSLPYPMASLDMMPPAVQAAPKTVQRAYQFAVANPEVLTQIPCYCGCGGMGHTSNRSCYVSTGPDGTSRFDGHALGCSICVDIALDTMRLLEKGSSVAEIKLYVDGVYSRYGPSNIL